MRAVTITVDPSRFENPIHRGMDALRQLKERGVPVIGCLFPESVEHGTLTIGSADLVSGEVSYSWQPDATAT